ncbi:DNA repair protein RadA [Clostridium perfringens]|uniref:DNA repair protein RadA n=1 Tax=Clostridium perfringens TaxID=1502 RepID=UPI0001725F95|nr:DNA repair protein RadA [Clostridium perfringens]EDT77511.1 DNA repair protein RadA [Clostridium perfringens NCTC 8239]MDT7914174.1 DNA repair protein RadA [Clostridium perfringens]MDT7927795.1 DNA repair protein RadA [Clostridium perfringens]MDT7958684.1 DNA repair protein RadA [Clostridium perfringens]MDT7976557.1 DNA repair protein RadA [Clostridium perfringens]
MKKYGVGKVAKVRSIYVCQNCGYETPKWMGKCPECNNWNTLVEEIRDAKSNQSSPKVERQIGELKKIKEIKSGEKERYDTGIGELNRVLGGGLVKGSLTLISGDPGIGKSTLLLQTANNISKKYGKVLYVSGEESEEQIKIRGDRLKVDAEELYIVSETNLDVIEAYIDKLEPAFIIIDSIQTIYRETVSSAPGSVSQVKECSNAVMRIAKGKNIPLFIVAHVTKQGDLAGPRVLEHMVDTVLSFEGERTEEFRILRTMKNRFGTTAEIGVFEMRGEGLMQVYDPSSMFLEDTSFNQEGSVVIGVMEGTRPILVEIQSLASETKAVMPRRTSVGVENSRLSLILAVLEKKLRVPFYNTDVYVNVVGGLEIEGTTADLGIAISLVSSVKGKAASLEKLVVVGEVGLTGEIRPISNCDRILNEAEKMGFLNAVVPYRSLEKLKGSKLNLIGVKTVREAIGKIF